MRIRTHLGILVAAVLAPVVLLAGFSIQRLWVSQREVYQQRFLERVSALRLALDTEFSGMTRMLQTVSEAPDLAVDEPPALLSDHLRRVLAHHAMWSTMGLVADDGTRLARLDVEPLPEDAVLDADTRLRAVDSASGAVSNLVNTASGNHHLTFVAVRLVRTDRSVAILYAGIDQARWLTFLQRYPISEEATLTLVDRNGRIIARTLNNDRWAGEPAAPDFWAFASTRREGALINSGLEGQRFYSAFSHSAVSGWLLGTGIPSGQVEAALRSRTTTLLVSIAIAGALAALSAIVIGRRISGALTSLAASARATTGTTAPASTAPLEIDEAERVRQALEEAAAELHARERSLGEALRREAVAREDAERASRGKDEFLAMLGHELRNPLSAMSTASMLLGAAGDNAELGERARLVLQRQIRHLTAVVDDLLDVSRLTSGKVVLNRQTLDLSVVAEHVVSSFRDSGRCGHLTVETHYAPAPVYADETRLEQVIANLLDNACKYTPRGGTITVAVAAAGEQVRLGVTDTGSGIPPDLLPRIFDMFAQGERTLDRAQGGLGLGLTVVRRLVELHGGTIRAESDGPDRGSTFIVELPRAGAPAVHQAVPERPAAIASRHVVLVEDNADIRDTVAAFLQLAGHRVTAAADGEEGLRVILDSRPDVALVDLGLPKLTGVDVARAVRRTAGSTIRLIALTGYGGAGDRTKALEAGFDAFLTKPFDLERFEAAARPD
jgi:signal transduction histidine kinase